MCESIPRTQANYGGDLRRKGLEAKSAVDDTVDCRNRSTKIIALQEVTMTTTNYEAWKTRVITGEPELSIVIPTYNEEERILPTIGAVSWFISKTRANWELIISDDGSRDQTVEAVRQLELANLRVLTAPRHVGKGEAVRQGMLDARGRYVLYCDADNSTPIEEINRLLPKVEQEGYDIAIGSRDLRNPARTKSPLLRHWLRRWRAVMVRQALHLPFQDTQCGFRLFTQQAAQNLFQAQTLKSFAFEMEILYLAMCWQYTVAEVPIGWVDAFESRFTAREFQRFVFDLPRIRQNHRRDIFAVAT